MKANTAYLGIDTGKNELHLGNTQKFIAPFNNTQGHQQLIQQIKKHNPTIIAIEASGGYERPITQALQDAKLPIAVVAPGCVRYFAKSAKVLAKTDAIDSVIIARYAKAHQPRLTPKTPESTAKLRALTDRRNPIIDDRVREQNRLETCPDQAMRKHLQQSIRRLQAQEKKFNQHIEQHVQRDEELNAKTDTLTQVVGIGKITAITLLAHQGQRMYLIGLC